VAVCCDVVLLCGAHNALLYNGSCACRQSSVAIRFIPFPYVSLRFFIFRPPKPRRLQADFPNRSPGTVAALLTGPTAWAWYLRTAVAAPILWDSNARPRSRFRRGRRTGADGADANSTPG
jgi:hypothetical protein